MNINNFESKDVKMEKQEAIKAEESNINKENLLHRINKNKYRIPIRNSNKKKEEIFSPYYKILYHKYKHIFGNINIFNSILIMFNNNYDIKNQLGDWKKQIEFLEKNFKFSLVSILYHSNQYIYNNEKKYSKTIFNTYTEFIKYFSKSKLGQIDNFLFDINNIEYILAFIYSKIDYELAFANSIINNININNKNLYDELEKNNDSNISCNFRGFYQYNDSI